MPNAKLVKKHFFSFNPDDPSGESLCLVTEFYDNGDCAAGLATGIFTNHKLKLQSYGNDASINLYGIGITPESLRKLADELEKAEDEAVKIASTLNR